MSPPRIKEAVLVRSAGRAAFATFPISPCSFTSMALAAAALAESTSHLHALMIKAPP